MEEDESSNPWYFCNIPRCKKIFKLKQKLIDHKRKKHFEKFKPKNSTSLLPISNNQMKPDPTKNLVKIIDLCHDLRNDNNDHNKIQDAPSNMDRLFNDTKSNSSYKSTDSIAMTSKGDNDFEKIIFSTKNSNENLNLISSNISSSLVSCPSSSSSYLSSRSNETVQMKTCENCHQSFTNMDFYTQHLHACNIETMDNLITVGDTEPDETTLEQVDQLIGSTTTTPMDCDSSFESGFVEPSKIFGSEMSRPESSEQNTIINFDTRFNKPKPKFDSPESESDVDKSVKKRKKFYDQESSQNVLNQNEQNLNFIPIIRIRRTDQNSFTSFLLPIHSSLGGQSSETESVPHTSAEIKINKVSPTETTSSNESWDSKSELSSQIQENFTPSKPETRKLSQRDFETPPPILERQDIYSRSRSNSPSSSRSSRSSTTNSFSTSSSSSKSILRDPSWSRQNPSRHVSFAPTKRGVGRPRKSERNMEIGKSILMDPSCSRQSSRRHQSPTRYVSGPTKKSVGRPPKLGRNMEIGKYEGPHFFYLAGQYVELRKLMAYNLETNSSKEVCSFSSISVETNCAVKYANNQIYVMGGQSGGLSGYASSKIHIYDMTQGHWKRGNIPSMIRERCEFDAVVVNDFIYAVGGDQRERGGLWENTNCVERLPINSNSGFKWKWQSVDFMQQSRQNFGLVALNDIIYVVGGYAGSKDVSKSATSTATDSVESLNTNDEKMEWVYEPSLLTPRVGPCAVATHEGVIYCLGGGTEMNEETSIRFNTTEIFNPKRKPRRWVTGPSMIKPRQFFSAFFHDGFIYVVGGDNLNDHPTMERLDLRTQVWTLIDYPLDSDGNYWSVGFKN